MVDESPNRNPIFAWLLAATVMTLSLVAILVRNADEQLLADTPVTSNFPESPKNETPMRFKTTIHSPSGPPKIELTQADPQGRVGSIACSTCHSLREPNFDNRTPEALDQFHQNMPMAHGNISCYSCHNSADADTLRLADTTVVEFTNVMSLCSQCHGTQARDYEHGAHGGMNGYWDLSRGPRTRNNCVDCHDPHVPKFPTMQPTFKPYDRFLTTKQEASHE